MLLFVAVVVVVFAIYTLSFYLLAVDWGFDLLITLLLVMLEFVVLCFGLRLGCWLYLFICLDLTLNLDS